MNHSVACCRHKERPEDWYRRGKKAGGYWFFMLDFLRSVGVINTLVSQALIKSGNGETIKRLIIKPSDEFYSSLSFSVESLD
jgi:hypothetical protein